MLDTGEGQHPNLIFSNVKRSWRSDTGAFYDDGEGDPNPPPPQENVQHKVAHKRLQETQAQVAEVTGILKKNVDLILQRDEKLTDLDDRAEALNDEASEFGKQTGKLKRKFWWQNCKMLAVLIGICLVILVIILVWAISKEEEQ